jgi:predicted nucleic acid-binding protein
MRSTLVDAGPLIALFDRDDHFHQPARGFIREYKTALISTWPVATEVSHMLDFELRAQLDFLRWIERGGLTLLPVQDHQLPRVIELMDQYADRQMDLSDATLVLAAETLDVGQIGGGGETPQEFTQTAEVLNAVGASVEAPRRGQPHDRGSRRVRPRV